LWVVLVCFFVFVLFLVDVVVLFCCVGVVVGLVVWGVLVGGVVGCGCGVVVVFGSGGFCGVGLVCFVVVFWVVVFFLCWLVLFVWVVVCCGGGVGVLGWVGFWFGGCVVGCFFCFGCVFVCLLVGVGWFFGFGVVWFFGGGLGFGCGGGVCVLLVGFGVWGFRLGCGGVGRLLRMAEIHHSVLRPVAIS
ncbi:hypothetical protein, partial [Pseudomonas syringae group genomosp. 7]|uniref:hypothetical protein n=1 Tax=Pseudomonas syringae group genomosp. 7 TaxID=251699 RepID=UPI00376FD8B8